MESGRHGPYFRIVVRYEFYAKRHNSLRHKRL